MLARNSLSRKAVAAYAGRGPRRRFHRIFTLVLLTILISTVYYLFQAHYASVDVVYHLAQEKIERLKEKPKKTSIQIFYDRLKELNEPLEHPPAPPPPPAKWESFPFLKRYHGGIRSIVTRARNKPEYPGGDDSSAHGDHRHLPPRDPPTPGVFQARNQNSSSSTTDIQPCYIDPTAKIPVPNLFAFPGVVEGMPDHVMGSPEMLGLNDSVCFDRYGRLGAYGLGYSKSKGGIGAGLEGDQDATEIMRQSNGQIDYRKISWAAAQEACFEANKDRFEVKNASVSRRTPRSVVVLRAWHDYTYDPEDILYLRSLVSELSLASGGEYDIHFLVHVRDTKLKIWKNDKIYERVLNDSVPPEFRGMATLWSEPQMERLYKKVPHTHYADIPIHSNYRSTFMPMQEFAQNHPEYDFFWNWELDTRYTGHWYHLFSHLTEWAKQQPRKGLWERNGRFYIPREHGTWDEFSKFVANQVEEGKETPIWGPNPPPNTEMDLDSVPRPPTTYEEDNYEWGVGEDADLITLNPLFDPEGTGWLLTKDAAGFNPDNLPPRRTAIITNSRLSRRLLTTMHKETSEYGRTMFSEMWPGSCALHHGLKAVYAPHPIFIDRHWPTDYLNEIMNGGKNGASGGAIESVFTDDHQHNFLGVNWYYHAGAPERLWRRWMGLIVDNDFGPAWETENEGRMCLPGMLLHPVKQIDLVYESEEKEKDTPAGAGAGTGAGTGTGAK